MSNVLEWYDDMVQTILPAIHPDLSVQAQSGVHEPFIAQEPTPIIPVVADRAGFIMSSAQRAARAALEAEEEKEDYLTQCQNQWMSHQLEINAMADSKNKMAQSRYVIDLKKEEESKINSSKAWTTMLTQMSTRSRDEIRNFSSGTDSSEEGKTQEDHDDHSITSEALTIRSLDKPGSSEFESARADYNFVALLDFAIKTHLISNTGDPRTKAKQVRALKASVENFKQGRVPYFDFIIKWDNRVRMAEAVGVEWSTLDKIDMLVEALNKTIFVQFLENYNNTEISRNWTFTIKAMRDRLKEEYARIDPTIISAALRSPGTEVAFGVREKDAAVLRSTDTEAAFGIREKEDTRSCYLCDATGRTFHPMNKCPLYDESKPPMAQVAHWSKASKAEKDSAIERVRKDLQMKSSESNIATQQPILTMKDEGTYARPKEENTKVCIQWEVSAEYISNRSLLSSVVNASDLLPDSLSPQLPSEVTCIVHNESQSSGVPPGSVDMTLDTASESNVAPPFAHDVVLNHREDPVYLKGVGGRVLVPCVGDIVFGKTRLIDDHSQLFLLSQYQLGDRYKVVDRGHHHWTLEGREGTIHEGECWHFWRDFDRYGDNLLHCTVSKAELLSAFRGVSSHRNNLSDSEGVYLNREMRVPILPNESLLTADQVRSLDRVESVHIDHDHASAQALLRTVASELRSDIQPDESIGVSSDEIHLWHEYRADKCVGCTLAKIKEHPRQKSKKQLSYKVGEAGAADLLFVEQATGTKAAYLLHIDLCTKTKFVIQLTNKSEEQLLAAYGKITSIHDHYNHTLRHLYFDRESGIVSLKDRLMTELKVYVHLKAASQKVGLAEVEIRYVKESARATKLGAQERLGIDLPGHFNIDLLYDVVATQNTLVKYGYDLSPIEQFTGIKPDRLRQYRGINWGEIVIAKRPKNLSSIADLRARGEYALVVRRYPDRSGVLKVWLPKTGYYAYRFKVRRVRNQCVEWILKKLSSMNPRAVLGFEPDPISDGDLLNNELYSDSDDESYDSSSSDDDDDIEPFLVDRRIALENRYRRKVAEPIEFVVADNQPGELHELEPNDREPEEVREESNISSEDGSEIGELPEEISEESDILSEGGSEIGELPAQPQQEEQRRYPTRERRPSSRLKDSYTFGISEINDDHNQQDEYAFASTIQEAVRERPLAVAKALEDEIDNFERKHCWKPIHEQDLSPEQRKLILDKQLNTWKEKKDAVGNSIKDKTRVVTRGDLQMEWAVAKTYGPVCRVESIFLILAIAALQLRFLFKVDFVAAFLNTPMPPEVLHRWIRLNRMVSKALIERDPAKWAPYLCSDGSIVVEMLKLNYGYREAGHYWGVILDTMFTEHGYEPCPNDPRVYTKRVGSSVIHIGVTVDDCAGASDSRQLIEEFIAVCRNTFQECTIEWGPEITLIGLRIVQNIEKHAIEISQPGYIRDLANRAGVNWTAPTPALTNLFENDPTSTLLSNQSEFLSLNAGVMFPAKRAYPQCLLAARYLAQFYGKATQSHMTKVKRIIAYMLGTLEKDYCFKISPTSLDPIVAADASYGEHEDGRSHSAGCIGLGDEKKASFFMFHSSSQPIICKSSAEAELVCASTVVDYGIWLQQMLLQMGYGHRIITLLQDNTASIRFIKEGHGTWKRTKHIKIRYFWLKMLIDSGDMVVKWVPSKNLVADILSKPVTGSLFITLLILLLCW